MPPSENPRPRIDEVTNLTEDEYRARLAAYMAIDGGPVWAEAWRREESHNPSHREYRPDVLKIGSSWKSLVGEKEFADQTGLEVDLSPRPDGDGLVDFRMTTRGGTFDVDVKTASKAYYLIVETHKIRPRTIYVLCGFKFFLEDASDYHPQDSATILGWQWGKVLMRSEPRTFGKHKLLNYHQKKDDLRKMPELLEELAHTKNSAGFVGYDDGGRLLHYCHCGKWASFGSGFGKDSLGTWHCREHRVTDENQHQRANRRG